MMFLISDSTYKQLCLNIMNQLNRGINFHQNSRVRQSALSWCELMCRSWFTYLGSNLSWGIRCPTIQRQPQTHNSNWHCTNVLDMKFETSMSNFQHQQSPKDKIRTFQVHTAYQPHLQTWRWANHYYAQSNYTLPSKNHTCGTMPFFLETRLVKYPTKQSLQADLMLSTSSSSKITSFG